MHIFEWGPVDDAGVGQPGCLSEDITGKEKRVSLGELQHQQQREKREKTNQLLCTSLHQAKAASFAT